MKVGLIDVDGHNFPNLALMKLSAYHKSIGDECEWWWGWSQYDRVYKFKKCPDFNDYRQTEEVFKANAESH